MKGWFLLFAFPFLLSAEITWQADVQKPFALSIKLSSEKINLDDFLYLDAEFRYPLTHELNLEGLVDQLAWSANPLAPRLSVYQTSIAALKAEEGVIAQQLHAVIRPLAQGLLDVSFLNVAFQPKDKSHSPVEVLTPAFTIEVLPLKEQTLLPFAPLIPLEPEFPLGLTEANRQFLWDGPERQKAEKEFLQRTIDRHTFPWVTLAVLIGFGGIGWTIYLMRDRLPKRKRKAPPAISPKQQAEKALQVLHKRKLIDQGLTQVHTAVLSSILLEALEVHAGRKLKELTTEELAKTLKKDSSFTQDQKNSIFLWLKEVDKIKFAGKKPSAEETRRLEQEAVRIIHF